MSRYLRGRYLGHADRPCADGRLRHGRLGGLRAARRLGSDEDPLGRGAFESWQPYFGWAYGLGFTAVLVGVCRWLAIDRGVVWLLRTWVIGGALVAGAWWLSGRSLDLDGGVTLVAGLGAYVLAAGLAEGHLAPDTAGKVLDGDAHRAAPG